MGKVVNLNRFRKQKARADKQRRAEGNRRLHGRTKAERTNDLSARERLEKKLAGALLVREAVDAGEDAAPDDGQSPQEPDSSPAAPLGEPPAKD